MADTLNIGDIIEVLKRIVKDYPTHEVFQPFRRNPILKFEDLSPERIDVLIDDFVNVPDTLLEKKAYQEEFIKFFIKYVQEWNIRSRSLGRAANILESTDKRDRAEIEATIHQIGYRLSAEMNQFHLKSSINSQSNANTPQQTFRLKSQLQQRKLLLVRGPSGQFDRFVSEDEITRALESKQEANRLRAELGDDIQSFNALPRQNEATEKEAALLPIIIQPGTQTLQSDLANLEAQFLLQKAVGHLDFLSGNKFSLIGQMLVDAQTQKLSAEMIDTNGERILVRAQMLGEEMTYNLAFITGQYAGQIMSLTANAIENYRRQELNARQIFEKLSRLRAAEQAEEEAGRRATEFKRRQKTAMAERDLGIITAGAVEGLQKAGNLEKVFRQAEQVMPSKIRISTPTQKPTISVHVSSQIGSEARIQVIRQRLREGKTVTGTLQAKKALAARHAENVRRQREAEASGRRDTSFQITEPKPSEIPKSAALAGGGTITQKSSRGARWIGALFGTGVMGGAGGISILDALDLL